MLSGLAMIVVGVWLLLQGIGGNLAARIRDWAAGERRFSGFGGSGGFTEPDASAGGSSWGTPSSSSPTGGSGGSRVV